MAIPDETEVYLKFSADTLQLIIRITIMWRKDAIFRKDSVITLKKLDGNSPCTADPFKVTYKIDNDSLWIKSLLDACEPRYTSWPAKPFIKVTD